MSLYSSTNYGQRSPRGHAKVPGSFQRTLRSDQVPCGTDQYHYANMFGAGCTVKELDRRRLGCQFSGVRGRPVIPGCKGSRTGAEAELMAAAQRARLAVGRLGQTARDIQADGSNNYHRYNEDFNDEYFDGEDFDYEGYDDDDVEFDDDSNRYRRQYPRYGRNVYNSQQIQPQYQPVEQQHDKHK